ncbi:glycoside hydrolase family 88 protein [Paenibacillus alba]|uniref:Glycoside hydrolase family 88 protein n=1 Tax=Paenibacillus alba TaxID=1197127 RepID=A0ABU6G0H2_9BACL|nr:glycoside hydrolase family 88 protein [Paenibacillus alba]MEC0227658.1 glycoside hydrolase family 88 protein [Paenibacillus alba]
MNSLVETMVDAAWLDITKKMERISGRIGDSFPHVSVNGRYDDNELDWWTNGFWPGILWMVYEETRNPAYRQIAESCENKLDRPLHDFEPLHHDVGFMWSLSSVASYKLTGNALSKRRALTAASHLAGRFNSKGNFIRAWNGTGKEGWAIIDCLMNLPLLFWASETTGDPRFMHIAQAHADTVMREFLLEDGSVHHVVVFDPHTGLRVGALGGQGYSAFSAWSRGAAWAVYGLTLAYGYTQNQRYLDKAIEVSRYVLKNLPADRVPPWDFKASEDQIWAKDSSAAACLASGLLEIAKYSQGEIAEYCHRSACDIMQSLYSNYFAHDSAEEGLLKKATVSFPDNRHIEVPVIYGDYFFIEALLKLKGRQTLFW